MDRCPSGVVRRAQNPLKELLVESRKDCPYQSVEWICRGVITEERERKVEGG